MLSNVPETVWERVPYGQSPLQQLTEFWRRRKLLVFLLSYGVGRMHNKALLGMAWLFIRPAIMVGGAILLVGHMLGVSTAPVPLTLFMLVSFAPWLLFQRGLLMGTRSFSMYRALVSRFLFPRTMIQIASITPSFLVFLLVLGAAIVAMIYFAITGVYVMSLGWHTLWVLVAILMIIFMVWGMGFFMAPLNAMASDVALTLRYLITVMMILSPVFYPIAQVPPNVQAYMWYNPLACTLELYRWGLFHQHEPSWMHVWLSWGVILTVFMAGWWFFLRCEQRALDEI